MGKIYEEIDDKLAEWLQAQPLYIVATAPLSGDGLVNASPKGGKGTFAVLDPHRVGYLDLTGSGIETIAHLRENGRIVLMFMSFERKPNIVRLHGTGHAAVAGGAEYDGLIDQFPGHVGARAIIVVDVARVADSCGYAVPFMEYVAERDVLDLSHAKKGADGLVRYRAEKNASSLGGLPGLSETATS